MTHPLVAQLRFTRSEWLRGLQEVTAEEALRHFGAINSISWMVGHMAWQEQAYWLQRAQGFGVRPRRYSATKSSTTAPPKASRKSIT